MLRSPPYLRAALALLFEQAWPALWPALATLGVFLCLSLADIPSVLPFWLHLGGLAVFGILFLGLLGRGLWRISWPGSKAARRRIETASGLVHRPLTALQDKPATDDPMALALWQAHLDRVSRASATLKAGTPRAGLLRRDPFALRVALALALIVLVVGAGRDGPRRVLHALTPSPTGSQTVPVTLDLWITPPAYTGAAPIFLSQLAPIGPSAKPGSVAVPVPTGSTVLAQVSGTKRTPLLDIDKQQTPFAAIDPTNHKIETKITEGSSLGVSIGGKTLGHWAISVIPDKAPTAAFTTPPSSSNRQALRLDYHGEDDYAVESLTATIRRADAAPEGFGGEPMQLTLSVPVKKPQVKGVGYFDLTPHPWAGLPVEIQLTATDSIGQTGTSEWTATTLPERRFNHPLARAIIEQRKVLVLNPQRWRQVGQSLVKIAVQPRLYGDDTVVFLSLITARDRLSLAGMARTPEEVDKKALAAAVDPVQQLLWDTAIRIEEGDAGTRERDLRAAEQALRDAIDRDAPDDEIQRLIDEMQAALDRFLEAMIQQALQNPRDQRQQRDPNARMVERKDLQKMLDQARQQAKRGQKDQARAMLDQLRDILENLQNAQVEPSDGDDSDMDGDNNAMEQSMQQLQDLTRRQRDLMDKSFRKSNRQQSQRNRQRQPGQQGQQGQQGQPQQGQPGDDGEDGDDGDMAAEQDAIRKQLGDLMRQLGEQMGDVPGGLGKAERAMRDAQGALGRGQPGQAVGPQGDALEQMRNAARNLAQQMQQNGQGNNGPQQAGRARSGQQQANPGRDPLGRTLPRGNNVDNSDIVIPDDNQVQRARDIFDELRRRSSDPDRPQIERDYIDRLLKRF